MNKATEGYVENLIEKVSNKHVPKVKQKVKKTSKEIKVDVIKSIQSLVSQKKTPHSMHKIPTKVTEKKEDSDESGDERASFKDYKLDKSSKKVIN